jgi:hypothetical protein
LVTAHDAALPVLMALRVKGRALPEVVATAAGISVPAARAAIEAVCASGAARAVPGAGSHALTAAGKDELADLLAAEPIDRRALAALYERFLAVDAALKARITEWQLLAPERRGTAATAKVRAAGLEAQALAVKLATLAMRFGPYARRLASALDALAGGDARFVASPQVDSLHQVWFELHEDLLVTLGRTRAP